MNFRITFKRFGLLKKKKKKKRKKTIIFFFSVDLFARESSSKNQFIHDDDAPTTK
jgi:hypothetical protein